MRKIDLIVIHCSASQPLESIDADTIRGWHKRRGWADIGYHFVIKTNGIIENGRSLEQPGAHVAGFNRNSIGICLIGGVDKTGRAVDNFFSIQKMALSQLLQSLVPRFPGSRICGHRDLSPDKNKDGKIDRRDWLKDCPCFDVQSWLDDVGITTA